MYIYVMRVVLILLFFAGNVLAALPARYMQTTKRCRHLVADWRQNGDRREYPRRTNFSVTPVAADYYAFKFGFGGLYR